MARLVLMSCVVSWVSVMTFPARGEEPVFSEAEAIRTLSRFEDRRLYDPSVFGLLLTDARPEIRRRAVLAAGRIGDPAAIEALAVRVSDDVEVATTVAFALGLIGGEEARPVILRALEREEIPIRVQAVKALGRLGDDASVATLREQLTGKDRPSEVGQAAAEALGRAASNAAGPSLQEALSDPDPEVRWRAAWALSRTTVVVPPSRLAKLLEDPYPLCRLYATRVAAASKLPDAEPYLDARTLDDDPRVVVEAVRGLGELGTPDATNRLVLLARHDVHHVRFEALRALGKIDLDRLGFPKDVRILGKAAVLVGLNDPERHVVAEAVRQYGQRFGRYAMRRAPLYLEHEDPWLRAAAAEIVVRLDRTEVFPLLRQCMEDPLPLVREAALRGVASSSLPAPPVRSMLISALESDDLSVLSTAADALGGRKEKRAVTPLVEAYARAKGAELSEARVSIVRALAEIGEAKAAETVRVALKDPEPSVRLAARAALAGPMKGDGKDLPDAAELAVVKPAPDTPDAEVGFRERNAPRVRLVTTKGPVVFELFDDEAPIAVHGFLERVRNRFYDGLLFHRVVANWVVQGGDPRGDGWGSGGPPVRDEVTMRRYVRGSIGVPTAGKDTGGCQVFITLVPAPRLEGNYTQIGKVVEGMEVVERIGVGDGIVTGRVE